MRTFAAGVEQDPFSALYESLFRHSEPMRRVEEAVRRAAESDGPVLIHGEAGAGKELVARVIHHLSRRSAGPWQRTNCAALPVDLLERDVFGHEPAGASGPGTPGKLELANRGTLFLAAIDELPAALQPRLVQVLQDHRFHRAGGGAPIAADVRILAASTREARAMAGGPGLREDLYRLLAATTITVPPLRERHEEIPFLVDHFCRRFAREFERPEPEVSGDILEDLATYDWPGNVGELENLVKRWIVLGDGADMRSELRMRTRLKREPTRDLGDLALGLREIGRRAARLAEQAALRVALERAHGNRAAAARLLKVSYKTLLQKLAEGDLRKRPRPLE